MTAEEPRTEKAPDYTPPPKEPTQKKIQDDLWEQEKKDRPTE
jgi:hypothetical protein